MCAVRVLIVFYSGTGNTRKIAGKIKEFFRMKKIAVEMQEILPVKNLNPKELSKQESIELKKMPLDLSAFDLIFVGGPIWGMQPSPILVAYLKKLENIHGKKFVLFLSCYAFTGNSIKKLSSILATKGAKMIDSFAIKSLFSLDEKKLKKIEPICEKIISKCSGR